MPVPPSFDRDAVKALFLSGIGIAELARRFNVKEGTLRVTATRGKWIQQRALARERATLKAKAPTTTIQAASLRLKTSLAQSLVRAAELLDKEEPSTLKELTKLHSELQPLIKTATQVFGWDKEQGEPTIRLTFLRDFSTDQGQPLTPGYAAKDPSMLLDASGADQRVGAPLEGGGDQISPLSEKNSRILEAVDEEVTEQPPKVGNTADEGVSG